MEVDEALVRQGLDAVSGLDDLDEEVKDYLCSMVCECDEDGGQDGVVELITPFLESYGLADDEEAASALGKEVLAKLMETKAIVFKSAKQQEKEQQELEERRQAISERAQLAASQAETTDTDTWGLNDVKNKKDINTTVDSISDALGNKKSLERQAKKAEKERLKEEAKLEREMQAHAKAFQAEAQAPAAAPAATTGKISQNVRNRSMDVHIENVNISVGAGKSLLEDAELKIIHGRKYGLLGKNGTGKTTLLYKISRKQLEGFPPYVSVVHVEQEIEFSDVRAVDYVLKADKELQRLLALEKELLERIESGAASEDDNEKMRKVYDDMAVISAESAEARARSVLSGLGFSEQMQDSATNRLSGGWRMRVALASALFQTPDVLLLDEPTNHLDMAAVLWLERYLQDYKKTLILVSHDRMFANSVITDVMHLENKKLTYYKGDIDVFETTRANQRKQQQREFEAQQRERAHMQKFVDKFRYNAKRASLAQSRIKALNRMTLIDEVIDDPEFQFAFPEPISELNKVIEVQEVSFGYPSEDGSAPNLLFENADFSLFTTSRMVLLGANGCGKSTLIKLIMDQISPTSGYIKREPKLRIGYFSQHHVDGLDVRQTPLQYMLDNFHGSKAPEVLAHLSRYGVTSTLANQRIALMSGGQKSRVAFAKITWDRPHLLILDEVSNHLDLESEKALAMAINTYEGGIFLVTHDQFLIEMCAEEIWYMQNQKMLQFKGTLQEYKKWAFEQLERSG